MTRRLSDQIDMLRIAAERIPDARLALCQVEDELGLYRPENVNPQWRVNLAWLAEFPSHFRRRQVN